MFHVLVIDDDEQMQFFLNEALRRQGYAVTLRKTAEEGLQVLKSDAADLVLLDIRLPGMSGLDAVGEILKIDPRVPIIMMTAHGTRDNAIDAIRRGAYDYFTKPFRLEEMEIVIRRALDKRKLLLRDRAPAGGTGQRARARVGERRQPGDERGHAPHRARGADRLHGAHPRRERRGQGTGGRVRSTRGRRASTGPSCA